jgi:hypothetical protein
MTFPAQDRARPQSAEAGAFEACEVRKRADIDRTGGMMVVLFVALAVIKFFG